VKQPVVLDIDSAVGALPGRLVLPLREWQEALRFSSTMSTMRRFRRALDAMLPAVHGTVCMGSGDFHHLTWPLVQRHAGGGSLQVVVLDNHPDNMRFPWGVHCGSWVRRVAELPFVSHVHVLGITSADIGQGHAWENYWGPLRHGKLTYWCTDVDTRWAGRFGMAAAFRRFADPAALVAAFVDEQRGAPQRTYLSIDKDVFSAEVARTNWDQGRFSEGDALAVIAALRGGIVGSDITGEVSHYRYRSWWKRRLSALDEQPVVDGPELVDWQAQQHVLNLRLVAAIGGSV
jgi:hypothetical protein